MRGRATARRPTAGEVWLADGCAAQLLVKRVQQAVTSSSDSLAGRRPLRVQPHTYTVALVGNPNTGKSTLFNALTGYRQRVANYPGVTVEATRGALRGAGGLIELIDLPGTYSLSAQSPDEMIVCDLAAGRIPRQPRPDAIVAIVDATNLRRNMYLLGQVLELDRPVVVAVNMLDIAARRGVQVDCARLSERLGVAVVGISATRAETLPALVKSLEAALADGRVPPRPAALPPALLAEMSGLSGRGPAAEGLTAAEALRVLADVGGVAEQRFAADIAGGAGFVAAARERLKAAGIDAAVTEVEARYAWIARTLEGVVRRERAAGRTWSAWLDGILTHRVGGFAILLAVLFVVFQAIFAWAEPLMGLIEGTFGGLAEWVGAMLPEGVVRSLVCDGLIAGVGGVLVFLPQILILFGLIALLEDCGYLSRAAFMMDRVMRGVGLSGRAFIPLLSSFACAIPAIMGTRTIADRRERFVTILLAPFMSCSARLPVYSLLIAAFVPASTYAGGWISLHGLVMLAMYLVGVVVALPLGWLLRWTVFKGPPTGFLLELPGYKRPRLSAVLHRMYFAGHGFVLRAGTVILIVNLLVWLLAYFPRDPAVAAAVEQQAAAATWDEARLAAEVDGAYLEHSYLGRMGRAIEPVVRPLGWDWRIGVAVIASFPAREVVIATLGTIFHLGAEVDPESEEGFGAMKGAMMAARWPDGRPLFTVPVALSIMVFFALCAQCSSTLVVIAKETGSWGWAAASFFGMTGLAYLAAWVVALIG